MSPIDTAAFIGKFVDEARDRLNAVNAALLRLEQSRDDADAVAEVLRQGHNLKGSARMLGLLDISRTTHYVEELFVAARRDPRMLDAAAFDVLFPAIDALSHRIEQLASGASEPPADAGPICDALAALASRVFEEDEPAPAVSPEAVEAAPAAPAGHVAVRESLRVPVEKLDGLTHLAAQLVIRNLQTAERHTELRSLEGVLGRVRDRMREARLASPGQNASADQGWRECAEAVEQISRGLRQFLGRFSDDCVQLHLITEEFRQTVIELTMLPLGTVFDAFPRAARDLARQFGKDVELTVRGRETELDKKIIEHIADPLVHLLRNAIDHGIEHPAERVASGKPAAGQLLIAAEQHGNRIVLTMRDDGRGIDPAMLRAAAVRDGRLESELADWTDAELLDLIFEPGFSTRDLATDVSGRGVGMDVVKDVVVRLGGTVKIHSERGLGTTVVLDLPLSLALLRVVLIEAGGELYAVPTAAVRRVLHVGRGETRETPRGLVMELGEETVPVASLSVLLNGSMAPLAARQPVLIAAAGDRTFGLIVEAVHEEQELVFEELRHPLRDHRNFAGAAILGSGDIVPILDVQSVAGLVAQAPAAAPVTTPAARGPWRARRVLVVEDSLVAGELQKSILTAAGYEAEIAHDGAEALEMLPQRAWDLVIADVDMPRMDGFELTARLRSDPRFRSLPVIIVTARDSSEDRRRGVAAGADAYVLKREFDQVQLLGIVNRLVNRAVAHE